MSKKAVSFDSLRINSPAQATVAMSPAAPVATQRAASGAGKAGKTIPVRLTVESSGMTPRNSRCARTDRCRIFLSLA